MTNRTLTQLPDMMGRFTDELEIAGENSMGDLPQAASLHKLTEDAKALSFWIGEIAEASRSTTARGRERDSLVIAARGRLSVDRK
jgi:hypothetical protein